MVVHHPIKDYETPIEIHCLSFIQLIMFNANTRVLPAYINNYNVERTEEISNETLLYFASLLSGKKALYLFVPRYLVLTIFMFLRELEGGSLCCEQVSCLSGPRNLFKTQRRTPKIHGCENEVVFLNS